MNDIWWRLIESKKNEEELHREWGNGSKEGNILKSPFFCFFPISFPLLQTFPNHGTSLFAPNHFTLSSSLPFSLVSIVTPFSHLRRRRKKDFCVWEKMRKMTRRRRRKREHYRMGKWRGIRVFPNGWNGQRKGKDNHLFDSNWGS